MFILEKNNYKILAEEVVKAQSGDDEAFRRLYEMTYQRIYFYALQLTKQKELAEDVVQDVYITIMDYLKTLDKPMAFMSWAIRIAYNRTMAVLNKERSGDFSFDEEIESFEKTQVVGEHPEIIYLEKEKDKELMSLILNLSSKHQDTILQHYYHNLPLKEIASITGCSVGTVKSRLSYAKKYLKENMQLGKTLKGLFLGMGLPKEIKSVLELHSKANPMVMDVAKSGTAVGGISTLISTGASASSAGVSAVKAVGIGKFIISTLLVSTVGVGIGVGSHLMSQDPNIKDISVKQEVAFFNHSVDVEAKVDHLNKGDQAFILWPSGKKEILSSDDEGCYNFKVSENGTYYFTIKSKNKVVEKPFEINGIDVKAPTLENGDVLGDEIVLTLADDYSGIDYSRIRGVGENGQPLLVKSTNALENKVIYDFKPGRTTFEFYDYANNLRTYTIDFDETLIEE